MTLQSITDFVRGLRKLCKQGRTESVLQVAEHMEQNGIAVPSDIIYHLLKVITAKEELIAARRVHALIMKSGVDSFAFIMDHLIHLLASCGLLFEANQVFHKISQRSEYTWHAIISAHIKFGEGRRALDLYFKMQEDVRPNKYVYICCLKACNLPSDRGQGRVIHDQIIKSGLENDVVIGSALIDMYSKGKSLEEACKVFDSLPNHDAVSWNAMISGYSHEGQDLSALKLFDRMQKEDMKPSKVTFLCALTACNSIGALECGRMIHKLIVQSEFESDLMIGNALIHMYAKCGNLEEACSVFTMLPNRSIVSWCAMISGHGGHGYGHLAIEFYRKMLQQGLKPEGITFLCILKACGSIGALWPGRLIHNQIVEIGLKLDAVLVNALLDMYAKCGSLSDARKLFDEMPSPNAISCGAMIAGYARHGLGLEGLKIYEKMSQEGIKRTEVTYLSILKACRSIGAIEHCRLIHDKIIRVGVESHVMVGNTLIDTYAKCGFPDESFKVFEKLPNCNLVSWAIMITGFADHGYDLRALELYKEMKQKGIEQGQVHILGLLKACGNIGAIRQGKLIHEQIVKSELDSDLEIGGSLVDMYARCWSLAEAHYVFEKLPDQDVGSWGSMIVGYAVYGSCSQFRQCFEDMQRHGLKPNDEISTSILSACSHAGLLNEAHLHIQHMREDQSINLNSGHYSCIIDLLGRAGHLDDAASLLCTMPVQPNITMWTSLLTSCRTFCKIDLGRWCFQQFVSLCPHDASGYVLMSNIYADACFLEGVSKI